MHAEQARKILLVRAVETTDESGLLLSDSMLRQAERRARETADPTTDPDGFLASRADNIYEQLATDSSLLRSAGRPFRYKALLIVVACLVALFIGFGLNELGSGRTINILAVPILVLIGWNVVICLIAVILLLVGWQAAEVGGLGSGLSGAFHWLIDRLSLRQSRSSRKARLAAHAAHEFYATWFTLGRRLHISQIRLILHAVAALLVIGAVGGMYWRGFAFAYRATWESTFLGADGIHNVLAVVLGPASAIMGNPIPDAATLDAIRESPVPAADWIHRYAITTLLFVIVPRTLLASVDAIRLRRLRQAFPMDWNSDPYFLGLLAADRGAGTVVVIQPYSFQPVAKAVKALKRQLRIHFGNQCDLQLAEPLEYGQELSPKSQTPTANRQTTVLLFNASQTPEEEVHGNLIAQFAAAQPGNLLVIIDETAFTERLGDDPQYDERLEQRRTAWRRILQPHGIEPYMGPLETFTP